MKKIAYGILLVCCLSGCSSTKEPSTNSDPLQKYNRYAYNLNSKVDKWAIRPAAVWYITYIPYPIRNGVANFYNNLRDFVTLGNDILQLNGMSSMKNVMRIGINSTFGILGIIDVSTSLGLPQNKNSFGNTMKVYGWENSSYFVIPLLGPSTVRDAIGMFPDIYFNPTWYVIDNNSISISLFLINGINTRSQFLGFDKILDTSIDPYITMRDTYLSAIGEPVAEQKNESNTINIDSLLDDTTESGIPKAAAKPDIERTKLDILPPKKVKA